MNVEPQVRDAESLSELTGVVDSLGPDYVYRGQSNRAWPLQTSLERACGGQNLTGAERILLSAFKSRTHHYNVVRPAEDDDLEWLALMQHYGAPTRLLDWTRSPYVGAYFGAENLDRDSTHFAVWAVHLGVLKRCALTKLNRVARRFAIDPLLLPEETRFGAPSVFKNYLLCNRYTLAAPVQAARMNDRLTTQQGLFLCMSDLNHSFEYNLKAALEGAPADCLVRIDLPTACRGPLLEALDMMNINRATLFPGLDGFAQHLRNRISMGTHRTSTVLAELGFL